MSIRQFVRPAWLVPVVLLALVLLPGCQDNYNENMVFPVRTDPVIRGAAQIQELGSLVGEVANPDPPGQLPLMSLKGIDDPRNLFHLGADHAESESHAKAEEEGSKKREKLKDLFFNPAELSSEQRSEFQAILEGIFGKPAQPKVAVKVSGAADHIKNLRLDEATLKEGGHLYRLHCMQCHGLTGDGRGPTSRWVNPHPRDYRPGIFKFQSVNRGENKPPRREDLFRTIKYGVEGTTMPAHNMLPDDAIEKMVSYVIFLSIRGKAELLSFEKEIAPAIREKAKIKIKAKLGPIMPRRVGFILRDWNDSQAADAVIKPGSYQTTTSEELKASVQRGQVLFAINCGKCHNDYGRRALYKMDTAGWGILVRPANLTAGVYRGGRRPIDLYWRIQGGINGASMPPQAQLTGDQTWDVVNFLQTLPYPAMHREHGLRIN